MSSFFIGADSSTSASVNFPACGTFLAFALLITAMSVPSAAFIESAICAVQAHGAILLFSGIGSISFILPICGEAPISPSFMLSITEFFFLLVATTVFETLFNMPLTSNSAFKIP